MWRLAEGGTELAAEVGAGEAGGTRQIIDVERFEITRVGVILRPEEVACRRDERGHTAKYGDTI